MLSYFLMPHPPIIIPEVGRGREEEVENTLNSCIEVGNRIEKLKPETIIIVTPHGTAFRDAVTVVTDKEISGDFAEFGAPEVKLNYEIDKNLTMSIIKYATKAGISVAHLDRSSARNYGVRYELDYGAMVPLYYADKNKNCKLVHITYGMLPPMELMNFGRCIKKAVKDSNIKAVFIASGNLSHRLTENEAYSYTPLGIKFDIALIEKLKSGDIKEIFNIDKKLIKEAGECGLRSLYVLAGAINSSKIKSELLSYEGPLGIGYGIMEFKGENNTLYGEVFVKKKNERNRGMMERNPYSILVGEI